MIRMLSSIVIRLLANAIGLLIAAVILSGFSIHALSFITALLILIKISIKNLPALMGGVALVTTIVGLIITDLFSTGISITGINTWILATLIVWLGALLAGLLLPLLIFKKALIRHRNNK
jgi:putative membrane protein